MIPTIMVHVRSIVGVEGIVDEPEEVQSSHLFTQLLTLWRE
jgi:hypothetical protein